MRRSAGGKLLRDCGKKKKIVKVTTFLEDFKTSH